MVRSRQLHCWYIKAIGYLFVDPVMAWRICDDLLIKPIRLSKSKAICGFNRKQASDVTHVIYPTMTVQEHRETTTPMLITQLGQHQIILGKPWMKKHSVILNMQNNWISYWPGHYEHDIALRLSAAEPQAEKPCVEPLHAGEQHTKKLNVKEPRPKKPHAGRSKTILK